MHILNRWPRALSAGIGLYLTAAAHAAYLTDLPVTIRQPDGTEVSALASGDEYYNWVHDKKGYVMVRRPDTGHVVYAARGDKAIVPTSYVVGKADPAAAGLTPDIRPDAATLEALREERFTVPDAPRIMGDMQPAARTGTVTNVVIFVRFSDETEYTTSRSTYQTMLNGTTGNSLYNYYREASYQQFTINSVMYPVATGTTIVSYQDTLPRRYYQPYDATTNPDGYANDTESRIREHSLLVRAVNAVSPQIPTNTNLDTDGDGRVDNIVFVIKGATGAWSSLLWPHAWALYTYNVSIHGKRVYSYSFQLNDSTLSRGVGVLAHETGHTIGMPDLYRYNAGEPNEPVGSWDVMANNANPPQHMGAYMKSRYLGWISSIPEITTSGTYTLNPLSASTNNCYKIKSPNSTTEYFVLEYRRRIGTFEMSAPGSGLVVYRINTARNGSGNAQGPPDEVYIYRPGGSTTSDGTIRLANLSSTYSRTQITDAIPPGAFLSSGSPGGLNITNVGAVGDTISFTVTLGSIGPSQLKFAINSGQARVGEILPFPVRVGLLDPTNKVVTDCTLPVTIALKADSGTPGANLLGTMTVNAVNGIAQFWDLRVDQPGTGYVLTATTGSLPAANSSAFTVLPFSFLFSDSVEALRHAAGFDFMPSYRMPAWDAVKEGESAGRVDLADVAAIIRKASGLEPNP